MKHGTPFSLPGQKVTHDVEIQNNWMNLIERRIEYLQRILQSAAHKKTAMLFVVPLSDDPAAPSVYFTAGP